MALWLVCDASGSMIEGGKRLILRGLLRQIEQYYRLGYAPRTQLKLVAWNDAAVNVPWQPGDEVPSDVLTCRGTAEASALISTLSASAVDDRYVIITDGFWADDARQELKRWRESRAEDSLRVIKTGADANPKLTGPEVFEAEDLFAALEGWLVA